MKIRHSTRQTAFRKVIRALKLTPQSKFQESDLMRHWSRTGLRYADLRIVLRDLLMRGQLKSCAQGPAGCLQISEGGSLTTKETGSDLLRQSLDWLNLRRARNRHQWMGRNLRHQRRADDR